MNPYIYPAPVLSEEQRAALRQYASTFGGQRAAIMSHMRWIADRLHEGATTMLTQAQLREEEAIENLVKAKAACDETVAPAEEVLAAAELVQELEEQIETLTKIRDEHGPATAPRAHLPRVHVSFAKPDPTYPSDADGVDEDEPKAGDCDA